ncbi:MAG: hypothetical protein CMC15_16090 [Flavobacteriaceae bacterium]|jgi:hypothetical protein|nr:hypothetical protein [Flavobacteriaceae bacterium]|tara:strand:- start:1105 stop:1332 length:228 start_codon:yes stop_codon:yes gene_type:complete
MARKVPKTKSGTPKKYISGAKNPKKKEQEIRSTAKKYKRGEYIDIQEVSRSRAEQAKKKTNKRKSKSNAKKKSRK